MYPEGNYELAAGFSSLLISTALVRGVDLYPPPIQWLPPNCVMEVDDVLMEWTWHQPFDLIHLRQMIAAFTREEWAFVYQQCFL